MTNLRWICLIITLLTAASSAVWARGGGHGGGGHNSYGGGHNNYGGGHSHLNIGIGYYGPGYYGYGGYGYGGYGLGGYGYGYPFYNRPYYSYPPTVIVPSTPPVYIQQVQPVQLQPNYWYYCQNPEGYYPYVKNCPGGWLQVAPQPSGQ